MGTPRIAEGAGVTREPPPAWTSSTRWPWETGSAPRAPNTRSNAREDIGAALGWSISDHW